MLLHAELLSVNSPMAREMECWDRQTDPGPDPGQMPDYATHFAYVWPNTAAGKENVKWKWEMLKPPFVAGVKQNSMNMHLWDPSGF